MSSISATRVGTGPTLLSRQEQVVVRLAALLHVDPGDPRGRDRRGGGGGDGDGTREKHLADHGYFPPPLLDSSRTEESKVIDRLVSIQTPLCSPIWKFTKIWINMYRFSEWNARM